MVASGKCREVLMGNGESVIAGCPCDVYAVLAKTSHDMTSVGYDKIECVSVRMGDKGSRYEDICTG